MMANFYVAIAGQEGWSIWRGFHRFLVNNTKANNGNLKNAICVTMATGSKRTSRRFKTVFLHIKKPLNLISKHFSTFTAIVKLTIFCIIKKITSWSQFWVNPGLNRIDVFPQFRLFNLDTLSSKGSKHSLYLLIPFFDNNVPLVLISPNNSMYVVIVSDSSDIATFGHLYIYTCVRVYLIWNSWFVTSAKLLIWEQNKIAVNFFINPSFDCLASILPSFQSCLSIFVEASI